MAAHNKAPWLSTPGSGHTLKILLSTLITSQRRERGCFISCYAELPTFSSSSVIPTECEVEGRTLDYNNLVCLSVSHMGPRHVCCFCMFLWLYWRVSWSHAEKEMGGPFFFFWPKISIDTDPETRPLVASIVICYFKSNMAKHNFYDMISRLITVFTQRTWLYSRLILDAGSQGTPTIWRNKDRSWIFQYFFKFVSSLNKQHRHTFWLWSLA